MKDSQNISMDVSVQVTAKICLTWLDSLLMINDTYQNIKIFLWSLIFLFLGLLQISNCSDPIYYRIQQRCSEMIGKLWLSRNPICYYQIHYENHFSNNSRFSVWDSCGCVTAVWRVQDVEGSVVAAWLVVTITWWRPHWPVLLSTNTRPTGLAIATDQSH